MINKKYKYKHNSNNEQCQATYGKKSNWSHKDDFQCYW